MTPKISIIIPLFNRADLVKRALNSCLSQSFSEWETIVVDDASTDASRAAVAEFTDARISLISLKQNSGQCVARNIGAARATAEWLLFLDSDDELTPGALEVVYRRSTEVADRVGRMFFACRWDDGTISPNPPFDGRQLDYLGFVRWLQDMHARPIEAISAVRRSAFAEVPYPNRRTHEGGHNLDFMKRFDFVGYPDIVRLYHMDADNRMTDEVRALDSIMKAAPGLSWMADDVLQKHGNALRQWAPAMYHDYLRSGGMYQILSGKRMRGVQMTAQAWLDQPTNIKAAVLLALSWVPVRTLARLKMRFGA
ncbi:MAG: glycosyltransferase family 2 protein [Gemmatimonadaceae bacterium]